MLKFPFKWNFRFSFYRTSGTNFPLPTYSYTPSPKLSHRSHSPKSNYEALIVIGVCHLHKICKITTKCSNIFDTYCQWPFSLRLSPKELSRFGSKFLPWTNTTFLRNASFILFSLCRCCCLWVYFRFWIFVNGSIRLCVNCYCCCRCYRMNVSPSQPQNQKLTHKTCQWFYSHVIAIVAVVVALCLCAAAAAHMKHFNLSIHIHSITHNTIKIDCVCVRNVRLPSAENHQIFIW